MSAERNLYRQAGTMAGRRLHHQHTPDASCTVLDRDRTQSQPIQFIPGITPGEAEAFAVIVDNEHNLGVILPQFYHDMRGASMLFYVVECFPVNLKEFAANAVRQIEHGRVDQEVQGDAGFIAEALGGAAHQFHQIGALHALRAHVHDHAAQFLGFVAHGVLQGAQLGGHLFGGVRQAAAEDVELDLDAEQSLENAVVEVAGDAAAFAFDGAHAQAAEQEQIFERRAKVAHDAFQPMQILRKLRAAGIGEHQPAHGVAVEIHGNPEHGTHAKLLNGLVGHARQFAEVLAVVAIPAEGGAQTIALIPTDAGFGIVQKKYVRLGERQIFRRDALGVAGSRSPNEDALDFGIPKGEDALFAVETAGEFAEHAAHRFRHAFFDLQHGGEPHQEVVLGGVQAIAVAHEGKADAARESPGHQRDPGKNFHPPQAAFQGGSEEHGQGHRARQQNGALQAPANSGRQGHKEIDEPEGSDRIGQQQEDGERGKVKQKRRLPFAQAGKVFEQQEQKSRAQVTQHKGHGVRAAGLRRFFQQNSQRQDHEDRAGVGDLPFEMAAFDALRLHGNPKELLIANQAGGNGQRPARTVFQNGNVK